MDSMERLEEKRQRASIVRCRKAESPADGESRVLCDADLGLGMN